MKTLPRILICLILWLGIGVGQIARAEGTVEKVVLPVGDLKVFAEIFGKVKSDYVEDIPDSQLLKDAIEVTMSSGYVAKLNGATVDFKRGSVVTNSPVLVFMNAGIIAANAMEILEKGKRVRFTERATMTINGDPTDILQENGL